MTNTKTDYELAKERYVRACGLCDEYIDICQKENVTDLENFLSKLSSEDKVLLEEEFWGRQTPGTATKHVLGELIKMDGKKLGWSVGSGIGAAGIGTALGLPATTVGLMGVGGFLLGDVIVTILEEDQATKQAVKPITNFIKNKIGNLTNFLTRYARSNKSPS